MAAHHPHEARPGCRDLPEDAGVHHWAGDCAVAPWPWQDTGVVYCTVRTREVDAAGGGVGQSKHSLDTGSLRR